MDQNAQPETTLVPTQQDSIRQQPHQLPTPPLSSPTSQNSSNSPQPQSVPNHEIDTQSNRPLPSATDPILEQSAVVEIQQGVNTHENLVDVQNISVHSLGDAHEEGREQDVGEKQALLEPEEIEEGYVEKQKEPSLELDESEKQQHHVQFQQPPLPLISSHRSILDENTEPIFSQTIPQVDEESIRQMISPTPQPYSPRTLITYKQNPSRPTYQIFSQEENQFDESKYFKMEQLKNKEKQLEELKKMKKEFEDSSSFSKKLLISTLSSTVVTGITAAATKNRNISALLGLTTFALSFIVQK